MGDPRAEAALLKHYRLQNPFPETWSDPIEEAHIIQRQQSRASTSRYSVLQEEGISASLKGLVGGDVYSTGAVPEDEPDPLGMVGSVARVLGKRGLPVRDNVRLRNRYLVSSKTFSPTAFLRDVHANTPSPTLQQGLDNLSTSIAQKSGSLKLLVESNFDRFVAAKGTIEGVYKEMKENSFLDRDRESEWGVGKIRSYLNDAGAKADEVFGPAMKGRGREEGLRLALAVLEKHRAMLEMPGNLSECIKRKDYESLIEEYQKARSFLEKSRKLVTTGSMAPVKEDLIHQLVIAETMWAEITIAIEDFKRDTWKRLVECPTEGNLHMELIGILLELGVDDNPVWLWLLSRYDYLKNRIVTLFERPRVEIEVLRRKVAEAPSPSPKSVARHLRSPSRRAHVDPSKSLDTQLVTSCWELVYSSLSALLSPSSGLVGELLSFQRTAQSFIDGDNLLPVGIDDQSRKHHRLEPDDVRKLQEGICELAMMIRDCLARFYMEPPVEDVSAIYSPIPATPLSANAPGQDPNFPPPGPAAPGAQAQKDEDEVYAFVPPGTNSLSGVHYLGKILVLTGNASVAICEMVGRFGRTDIAERFRAMVSGSRERAVVAVCAAWLKDAGDCKFLEDWMRAGDNRDVTRMPGLFGAFEREVISGMQAVVYLNKVVRSDSSVIPPPSTKLLSHVRAQFVRSLYKSLQGMVENAKKPLDLDTWDENQTDLASPVTSVAPRNLTAYSVDSKDKNVRILLTLSNLQLLRNDVVPELIGAFENAFSVKLTDESKTIRDAQSQIDAQLFEEYTKPLISSLSDTIRLGVLSPSWPPPPGKLATSVRPYIYTALLSLVLVHSQIATTAPSLTHPILSYLLEAVSEQLLEAFKQRRKFSLGELLQAALDVEFVNQTLSQYNTPRASELQQGVYVELDRGSDAEARLGLREGLGGMKKILAELRGGSRAEFLCFRAKKSSSKKAVSFVQ
ncbi:hypothetical protein C7212DRAFT_351691 [Tuber magnatum]|uniref:Exocyst complex component SEC5 n=1 Tax=Tuber magnatum TaxID=42249 RepID=A0A317SQS8_9PEZI|nr:hypothetical protein C7212DRAFT_351691 [Tuber magnatum]